MAWNGSIPDPESSTAEPTPDSEQPAELAIVPTGDTGSGDTTQPETADNNTDIDGQCAHLHIRLYIMADKYDVPSLKLHVYKELRWELIWRRRDSEWLPEVVDHLYSFTAESDHAPIRSLLCDVIAGGMYKEEVLENFREVMKKHGEFAVGVVEELARDMRRF